MSSNCRQSFWFRFNACKDTASDNSQTFVRGFMDKGEMLLAVLFACTGWISLRLSFHNLREST